MKRRLISLFVAVLLIVPSLLAINVSAEEADTPIYLDDSGKYTFEERAADLVSRMTLTEKAASMGNSMPAIPRLNIPAFRVWNEALHGIRTSAATSYPISTSMASTWNPEIINKMTRAIADEARAISNNATLGLTFWSPVVEPQRDPRWGRNSEAYSEDTFLTAQMGKAFVNGLMGDDEKYVKSYATAKHFIANNIENVRMSGTSHLTETDLYEYYIRPYRSMLLGSQLSSIMTSYNRVNNVPSSASVTLVDTLARKMWGMKGYVTGDCKAVSIISQNYKYVGDKFADLEPSLAIAAALALKAGVDTDCTSSSVSSYADAVKLGYVPESELDEALVNMFTVRLQLGQLYTGQSHPWKDIGLDKRESKEQQELAIKIAEEAIVLLENKNSLLPLKDSNYSGEGKKIALIGPYADKVDLGGYSGTPTVANRISPKKAIEDYVAANKLGCEVVTITGADSATPANLFNFRGFNLFYKDGTSASFSWSDLNAAESNGYREYNDWSGNWLHITDNGAEIVFNNINVQDVDYLTFPNSSSVSGIPVTINVAVSDEFVDIEKYENVTTTNNVKFSFKSAGQANGKVKFTFSQPIKAFAPEDLAPVADADLFLVFVGAGTDIAAEEKDRAYLHLPGTQQALVEYVSKNFKNTVVIMETMGMMEVETFKKDCDALIWYSYNGQGQGAAICNMLFGKSSPGAKLPFSWYKNVGNLPDMFDYTLVGPAKDGKSTGRTYMYYDGEISYPFGYGLTYTTFEYSNMKIDKQSFTPNDGVTVTVDVKNTGARDGYEIVQVYAGAPDSSNPGRPNKRLAGFDKVFIPAGETKTVSIFADASDMWYYSDPDGNSLNQEETPKGQKNTSPDLVVNGNIAYLNGVYTFEVASAASNMTNNGKAANSLSATATMQGELDTALQAVTFQSGTVESGKPQVIRIGEKVESALTISLNNDTFMDKEKAAVTYSSNREAVATVDKNGLVTATGEGVVTITATVTYKGRTMSDSFALKVLPPEIKEVKILVDTLVAGYAANIPVQVTVAGIENPAVEIRLVGENKNWGPVLTNADGYALLRVSEPLAAGEYSIVASLDGVGKASTSITVEAPPANLWKPLLEDSDGKLRIRFGAQISFANGSVTVGNEIKPILDVKTDYIVVDAEYSAAARVVIKGLKYPRLFPSYSFTFTVN